MAPHFDREESFLEDLPPLDGEEEDGDEELDDLEIDDRQPEPDTDESLAADLPVGELIDLPFPESSRAEEEGDGSLSACEIGVGIADSVEHTCEDDLSGIEGDDLSAGIDECDQCAEEGDDDLRPGVAPFADEVDESALPELDADDGPALVNNLLDGDAFFPAEAPMPKWSEVRWERVSIPIVDTALNSVVPNKNWIGAVGEGAVLMRPDPSGNLTTTQWPLEQFEGSELLSVVIGRDAARLVAISMAHAYRATGDGEAVSALSVPERTSDCPCRVYLFGGDKEILCTHISPRALAVSEDWGDSWRRVETPGTVLTATVDSGRTLVALVQLDDGAALLRTSDGVSWDLQRFESEPLCDCWAKDALMTANSDVICVASSHGALACRPSTDGRWEEASVPATVTALALTGPDSPATWVGSLFVESEDRGYLFTWRPGNAPQLVAELTPTVDGNSLHHPIDDSDGLSRPACVAWDEYRGWLWIAGRLGLQAWRPVFPA